MIESTDVVRYGRDASAALANAIADAQRNDPLAPVTVIVSSNFVGLSVRRLFGTGLVEVGNGCGLANVSFLTPFQLAELVAADLLLDTRPITNPVLGAAVRRVLADAPGPYSRVAEHEATEAALAALFAELSNVDEAGLEAMLEHGSTAASMAVGFHRAIASRLEGFHTENDLVTAAAERIDLAERLAPFGRLIWFLPAPTTQPIGRFLDRVLRDAPSSIVVGVSGDGPADAAVWRTLELAGVSAPSASADVAAECATADRIVSVTDPAEEIREVCSRVLGLLGNGVDADRIGVFVPTPDPYVRIIEQQFGAAGIPVNGPDPRRLLDSVAGRTLVGALALPQGRWRRDRVMAVVSGGPVRVGDERARPAAWDAISRRAGVVAGLGDWAGKLARHREAEAERAHAARRTGDERRAERLDGDVRDLDRLAQFLDDTATAVGKVASAPSWPEKCSMARELLVQLLGPEHRHSSWPDAEQEAFARVDEALGRLAALDEVEPEPSHAVFLRALRSELDVARRRHGRFGQGVMYGPLGSAVGHDLDAVFVVGAAEGMLPAPRRDDAILPEAVRMASLDQLEPKRDRLQHQHRAFLAALESAPVGQRTLVFPRGSLRSSRRTLPSRWLLDSASALAGRRIHLTDFHELGADVVESIGSFASGIAHTGAATSIEERDIASIDLHVDAEAHPLAQLVGRGLEMQAARNSERFTEFDGNLAGVDVGVGDRPLSPSRLETWATCGFRYLLRYVLGASDRDDPERNEQLSALDRGLLIHETLERFIAEAIANGAPDPGARWSPDDRNRLHELAADVASSFEATGRTGRPVHWRVQRDDLRDLLDHFITIDENFRMSHGVSPVGVELDFGVRSGTPVAIDLGNGRSVSMRGLADRIDVSPDGERAVVSDYKSGTGDKFLALDADEFSAGTTLQLGLYSEAALRETGASSVRADYWMIEADKKVRRGYAWTDALRERFSEVLATIVEGIEGGVFAAQPGEWSTFRQTNENCVHCDFDRVCLRGRGDQAEAKARAPELEVRGRLTPPADDCQEASP